jgi:uncharacterized protein (DUF433 family)
MPAQAESIGMSAQTSNHPRVQPADLEGDLISPTHPLYRVVWINPERMHGTPCFFGTRVPIQHLWEYLEGGDPLDEFLAGFPGVTREQAQAVLRAALDGLLARLPKL